MAEQQIANTAPKASSSPFTPSVCQICKKTEGLVQCSACKGVFYCSKEHQKENWKEHKAVCGKVKRAYAEGLVVETTKTNENGIIPAKGDKVILHYTGTLVSGKVVDSSRVRGIPYEFFVGQGSIKAFDLGAMKLKSGEEATFYVSPALAWGKTGSAPLIAPNTPLIFEVELLEVIKPK